MPQIDLVPNMRKAPGRCGICNTTPMEDGKPRPAIDTNVDVDWGNNLYICDECTDVIAGLLDWITPEEYAQMKAALNQLKGDHKRLRKKFKERGEDLKALAEGERIRNRVKRRVRLSA